MKIFRNILITLLVLILVIVIAGVSFVGYMQFSYYRIGNVDLDILNNQSDYVSLDKTYSMTTYNIGFGAYDRDYSFFMDEGKMQDGTKTQGKYGKGVSKENTLKNTNGSIATLTSLQSDFMMLEEVDTNSDRSYHINQQEMILDSFAQYSYTYASNFHSAFLPYPIHDMHGKVNSGILTLSKYQMASSKRIELPISQAFFAKFFDLDRCIDAVYYPIEGTTKMLCVISAHLSAYDEGGVYRKKQIELLKSLLNEEYEKGNYVIVGGDFNHDIASSEGLFPTNQERPDWIQTLNGDEFGSHYRIASDNQNPSCRDADIPYTKGETYTSVVDGFIVSDNISVELVQNIVTIGEEDVCFLYSDHNPVFMKFKLLS